MDRKNAFVRVKVLINAFLFINPFSTDREIKLIFGIYIFNCNRFWYSGTSLLL